MKNYLFRNDRYQLFEGFYNSYLDADAQLGNMTYNDRQEGIIAEDEEYDFVEGGWDKYKKDVCEHAAYLLYDNLEIGQDIVKDINLHDVWSPKYYNYETDKLELLVDFDLRKLKKYCFNTYKDDFNKYLNKFYTSCDGYISFVANNLKEFINDYNSNDSIARDRCISIMIEFYLLCNINSTRNCDSFDLDNSYQYRLIESANECLWDYVEPKKI